MMMTTKTMPRVNVEKLQETLYPRQFSFARRILVTSGEQRGQGIIRPTMPKVTEGDSISPYSAYIWRVVIHKITPGSNFPASASDSLPSYVPISELNDIIQAIIDNLIDD